MGPKCQMGSLAMPRYYFLVANMGPFTHSTDYYLVAIQAIQAE